MEDRHPDSDTERRVLFDALLTPHRSLSPRGFMLLMSAIIGIGLLISLGFFLIGAWPVVGFLGVEWLLLYLAFRINFRRARMFEQIRLTPNDCLVRRVDPGGRESTWQFQPYWLRVELDGSAREKDRLTLTSHGRSLVVGSFLTPAERRDLAQALRDVLARLRCTPAPV